MTLQIPKPGPTAVKTYVPLDYQQKRRCLLIRVLVYLGENFLKPIIIKVSDVDLF